jgi:hypothetical protein
MSTEELLSFVDALPNYKLIAKHAPNTIRGVLAIGAGRRTTCEDMCEALYREECEVLGYDLFAGYLYLPTCTKVCFECFTDFAPYQLLGYLQVQRQFVLNKETVDGLPHTKYIPGTYSVERVWQDKCIRIDFTTACNAKIVQHGSFDSMLDAKRESGTDIYDSSGLPLDWKSNSDCFAAILQVPWVNKALQEIDWGFFEPNVIRRVTIGEMGEGCTRTKGSRSI